jgi:hypothetical protein
MSCNGSHLGIPINIKKDLPMIDAQFRFNKCNSFREEFFLEDLQMIIPEQFGFNCPSGLREEAF